MMNIIFLIIMTSVGAWASTSGVNNFGTFGDALPIYVIGDASGVIDGFKFVAMIVGHDFTQLFILLGAVWALHKVAFAFAKGDGKSGLLEFGYIFFVIMFFLYPATTITVQDGRVANGSVLPDVTATAKFGYESYSRVDDIPLGIATIASVTTTLSWELANLLEVAIAPVSDAPNLGITSAGINQPAKDLRWIVKSLTKSNPANGTTEDYERRLAAYVVTCAMPTVDTDVRNATKIMNPPDADYVTYLSPAELPVAGTLITDPVTKSQNLDCEVYWNTYLSGANSTDFNDNILDTYRAFKKSSGVEQADQVGYETQIRKLINGESTATIAGLKDSLGALKRASVVAGAVDASGTGIPGIDMSNRLQMTDAKQSMMVQGPASFAWLGEILPLAINIGIAFLVVMSILMAIFLLFHGWMKGLGVILNFTAGFIALTFSYVSLAITQGIVNRRAYESVLEQYTTQGSPLQVSNYNFLLEQSATMDGLTGLLGGLFVAVGSSIIFYGESKAIAGGIMAKVQGSFGGNNLDKTSDDNAQDTALAESMERSHKDKMAKKLTDAGIPFDGGNIEYEYAKMQKHISDLGSAQGIRHSMQGETSAESMATRDNMAVASMVQSYDKSKQQQGFGEKAIEIAGGDLDSIEDLKTITDGVKAGSRAKGMSGASAMYAESKDLESEDATSKYVEGVTRDARSKVAGTMAKAVALGSDGKPVTQDEYVANAAHMALRKETEGQISSEISQEKYGKALGSVAEIPMAKVEYSERAPKPSKSPLLTESEKDQSLGSLKQELGGKPDLPKETKEKKSSGEKEDHPDKVADTKGTAKNADTKTPIAPKVKTESSLPPLVSDLKNPPREELKVDKALINPSKRLVAYPDGSTKQGGTRNLRNNNPGNIKYGAFAKANGAIGHDGTFAIFPSMEQGRSAMGKLLNGSKYQSKTMAGAISTYAPRSENDTGSYIKKVAKETGIGPSTPMSSLNSGQKEKLMDAMIEHEGNKKPKTGKLQGGTALYDAMEYPQSRSFGHSGISGSFTSLYAASMRKREDEFIGASSSAAYNEKIDPGAYGRAAYVADSSRVQGTSASIEAQGGVKGAIATSANMAKIAAAEQQASFVGKTTQTGVARGMSNEDAKKLAEGIANGSIKGSELLKSGIVAAARSASTVLGAEKEAQSQGHAKALKSNFGETLTDTRKSGSKTYHEFKANHKGVTQDAVDKENTQNQKTLGVKKKEGDELKLQQDAAEGKFSAVAKIMSNNAVDTHVPSSKSKEVKEAIAAEIDSAEATNSSVSKDSLKNIVKSKGGLGEKGAEKFIESMESQGADFAFFGGDIDKEDTVTQFQKKGASFGAKMMFNKKAQEIQNDTTLSPVEAEERMGALQHLSSRLSENGSDTTFSKHELHKAGFTSEQSDKLTGKIGNSRHYSSNRTPMSLNETDLGKVAATKLEGKIQDNKKVQDHLSTPVTKATLAKRRSDAKTVQQELYAVADEMHGLNADAPSKKKLREAESKADEIVEFASKRGGVTKGVSQKITEEFSPEVAKRVVQKTEENYAKSSEIQGTKIETPEVAENKANESTSLSVHGTIPSSEKSDASKPGTVRSYNDYANALADKKVDEFMGAGEGAIQNTKNNSGIYEQNALYGEQSKALSTDAKIKAQGGISEAVSTDTKESTLKAGMQKGSVEQQVMQLALSTGMGENSAKALVGAMADGGKIASELIRAGIVGAASGMASAQSGAKTRSDLKNIEMSGGTEDFIQSAGVEGGKKGIVAKTQNIDLLDKEKSQRYVEDLDSNVFQHQTAKERESSLQTLKNVGMLSEDSTPEKLIATSGEQFALGQAKLAAGAMDRSERFAVGKTSINAVRDVETGGARIESNSGNAFNDGDQVNHNYGMNIKNPVQFAAHESGAFSTTQMGTDDASIIDNAGGGVSMLLGGAAAVGAGYAIGNKSTGGALDKGYEAVKHKMKGHTQGRDIDGNKGVFYSQENWDKLETEGMAKKTEGGWELTEDRKKAKSFIANQPSSAGKDQNFQADITTNANAAPIKNASIKAPLDIYSPESGVDMSKYTTKSANFNMKNILKSMSDHEIGKNMLLGEAKTAQKTAVSDLKEVSKTGDPEKIDEAKSKVGATNTVVSKLESGKAPTVHEAKNAGLKTSFTDGKNIDLNGIGSATRIVEEAKLDSNIEAINQKNAVPNAKATLTRAQTAQKNWAALNSFGDTGPGSEHAKAMENVAKLEEAKSTLDIGNKIPEYALNDMGVDTAKANLSDSVVDRSIRPPEGDVKTPADAPKGKFGAVMAMLGLGTVGASASTIIKPTSADTPTGQSRHGEPTTLDYAFNTANAVGGALEISNGASTNIADLKSASAYKAGAKEVASDFFETKSLKNVGTELVENGGMAAGKALGKSALKKLPFVGVAAGATLAYSRAEEGDYMGAAMEFASGAVSMIPGVGTMASVAIDGALMKRDYDASVDSANKDVPDAKTVAMQNIEKKKADHSHESNKIEVNKAEDRSHDAEPPKENKAEDRSHEANKLEDIETKMDTDALVKQGKAPSEGKSDLKTNIIGENKEADHSHDANKVQLNKEADHSHDANKPEENKAEDHSREVNKVENIEGKMERDADEKQGKAPVASSATNTGIDYMPTRENKEADNSHNANTPVVNKEADHSHDANKIQSNKTPNRYSSADKPKANKSEDHSHDANKLENIEREMDITSAEAQSHAPNLSNLLTNSNVSSKVESFNAEANKISKQDDMSAGKLFLQATASDGNKANVLAEAKAGTLTPKKMLENGISLETVHQTPLKEDGTVDVSAVGQKYKSGVSAISGVIDAQNSPSMKIGSGVINPVGSKISPTASLALAQQDNKIEATESSLVKPSVTTGKTDVPDMETSKARRTEEVEIVRIEKVKTESINVDSPKAEASKIETVVSGAPSVEAPKVATAEVPNEQAQGSRAEEERRTTSNAPSTTEAPKVIKTTEVQTVTAPDTSSAAQVSPLATSAIRVPEATGTTPMAAVANQMHSEAPVQAIGAVAQPTPQVTAVQTPMATASSTMVAPQPMSAEQPQFIQDPNGSSEELNEMSKTTTSIGNVQTNRSDLKKSTDEGSAAIVNALHDAQNISPSQEEVSFNQNAIQSLVSGMAFSSPMQTQGGELNLSKSSDGMLALGTGENKVETAIPYDTFKNSSEEVKEGFASTLAKTKLNNDEIEKYAQQEDVGALKTMDQTEIVWNARMEAKQMGENARILSEDGNESLEYLAESFEKIESALNPKEDRKV